MPTTTTIKTAAMAARTTTATTPYMQPLGLGYLNKQMPRIILIIDSIIIAVLYTKRVNEDMIEREKERKK